MTEDSRSGDREDSGPNEQKNGPRARSGYKGSRDSRGQQGGRRDDRRGGHQGRRDQRNDRHGDSRGGNRNTRDNREKRGTRGGQGRRSAAERDPADIAPQLPEEVNYAELDRETKRDLNSVPKSLAELVGKHVVTVGLLLDEDPEFAYKHAAYARRKASRVPGVREVSGLAAYTLGKWQEALSDLRAARRMSGRDGFLPIMADCERGLGRPERALEIADDPAAGKLDVEDRVELRIVAAGARRDMGDLKAALVELQIPELKERRARPWVARLFYAYADILTELGRESDAREYFARAASVDQEGMTDADERLAALEGVELVDADLADGTVWTDAEEPEEAPQPAPEARD